MALSFAEVRAALQTAAREAGLPLGEERRAVLLSPPLPSNATSEDERVLFELTEPRDPLSVCQALNEHLPAGLWIEAAWIALPGTPDENPGSLDRAVYEVAWNTPPSFGELTARLREFFATSEIPLVRIREKKTQRLNVRDYVCELHVLGGRTTPVRLQVTLATGPQGTLKLEEVLQALGYTPAPEQVSIRRVALLMSSWRASRLTQAWQRRCQS